MARKVIKIARTGPWAQRWAVRLSLVLIVAAGLFFVRTVLAIHDTGIFQLDGDADSDTTPIVLPQGVPQGTDDWDKVCYVEVQKPIAEGGENLSPAAALARCGTNVALNSNVVSTAWASEATTTAAQTADSTTIFTVGSKDTLDVTQWVWKSTGGLPDKDNLLHGFAVRYSLDPGTDLPLGGNCETGGFATCEVLYFGSDRWDNEGSATTGVWFLQSKVTLGTNQIGGGFGFVGEHTNGDVLVTSEFSIGGTVSVMRIFQWNTDCTNANQSSDPTNTPPENCAETNLEQLAESEAANCRTSGADDQFCGLVNDEIITMPWQFFDKDNTHLQGANKADIGEFFEGGINLSTLGLAGECFQTVVVESRASAEANATTKDFLIGQLGECATGLSTQASASIANPVTPGTAVTDTAIVQITGATSPDDPTGTVTFFLCGPNASAAPNCDGTTLQTTGSQVGNPVTLSNTACDPDSPNDTDGRRCAVSATVNDSTVIPNTPPRGTLGPGFYCFRAEYSGDSQYAAAKHTNLTTECFRVRDTTSATSAQNWLPNDSATITSAADTALSGTVVFTLHEGDTCTGTVRYTEPDITLTNADSPATVNTTNGSVAATTFIVNTVGETKWSWKMVFTPGANSNVVGTTKCETTTININNNPVIP